MDDVSAMPFLFEFTIVITLFLPIPEEDSVEQINIQTSTTRAVHHKAGCLFRISFLTSHSLVSHLHEKCLLLP